MKKKKSIKQRRAAAWKAFCLLPRIDQYEMVHGECWLLDDFRNMLESPEDFKLKDIEQELKDRKKANK